jgi:hypothetical protein
MGFGMFEDALTYGTKETYQLCYIGAGNREINASGL